MHQHQSMYTINHVLDTQLLTTTYMALNCDVPSQRVAMPLAVPRPTLRLQAKARSSPAPQRSQNSTPLQRSWGKRRHQMATRWTSKQQPLPNGRGSAGLRTTSLQQELPLHLRHLLCFVSRGGYCMIPITKHHSPSCEVPFAGVTDYSRE